MTKNEFKKLAFALKVNARYSGKQQTMFINVHHLSKEGRFLRDVWQAGATFNVKCSM